MRILDDAVGQIERVEKLERQAHLLLHVRRLRFDADFEKDVVASLAGRGTSGLHDERQRRSLRARERGGHERCTRNKHEEIPQH